MGRDDPARQTAFVWGAVPVDGAPFFLHRLYGGIYIPNSLGALLQSGFAQGFSTFSTGLSTYVYVNVEKWIIHIGRHKTTVKGKLRGIFAKFTKDHKDTET